MFFLAEATRAKETWLARLRRLEYEQKSGALAEVSTAQRVVFDLCREQRDAWLAWPSKVAPLIAVDLGVNDRLATLPGEYAYEQLRELGEPQPDFTVT